MFSPKMMWFATEVQVCSLFWIVLQGSGGLADWEAPPSPLSGITSGVQASLGATLWGGGDPKLQNGDL